MTKLTTAQYEAIAQSAIAKGLTPEEFRAAMIKSGKKIKLEGITYSDVYYVRVMAIMHDLGSGEDVPEF